MAQNLALVVSGVGDAVAQRWTGGKGTFTAVKGSATSISLETMLPDGATWIAVSTATTVTANGIAEFELAEGSVRAQVVGTLTGSYCSIVGHR